MIRRTTKIQLAVFVLISLLGISYVSARYVGLTDRILGKSFLVSADFADSGGIFANAEVTYRGVTVGRVEKLQLSKNGVLVFLRLNGGSKVPSDTMAVVANRSAVGEQYVDLQPKSNGAPYLAAGGRIPRADTVTPLPVQTLLVNLDRLVNSVNRDDLVTVIDELGTAFKGTGPDLRRLISSGNALTVAATSALPETIRLIDDGKPVLDTQLASGPAIKSFSHDLALLSDTLRSSDPDLRAVLNNGIVAAQQLDGLLKDNRPAIAALLGNLLSGGQVTVARLDGVEQILVTYPAVVAGGYTVVPGDGTAHFGLVANADSPKACSYNTPRRSPQDTRDTPANTKNARCTNPPPGSQVRGAANAPGPRSGSADRTPSYLGGYDARTGRVLGTDGRPLLLGSPGGQGRLLGKDSWQWLLLGPLGA
ncbi:MAG: phospholipid/cholesterol/gamma-HCH transport system substrate-binding protein [Actinomycetota bacterium]|jgi:phospholipid/cholesterol/gamma-HCH transport system substrate-binding protein|nr:phospholipid/cholesterol/gamma-HCH transport system substrate-binding protein [Actinomycetota bacterium]